MYHTTIETSSFSEPKMPLYNNPGIYIDPLTDFGFKYLFGKELNKDILIDFLNNLFQGKKTISNLTFNNIEKNGEALEDRDVYFDLLCTGDDGEQFIIEMQRKLQTNFMDRCVYYTSRIVNEQAPAAGQKWDYKIKGVFLIGILDFELNTPTGDHYLTTVQLVNLNTNETFYPKLGYLFLELSKFDKQVHELENDLERWCYVLKHLHRLNQMPTYLNKRVFKRIFKLAEVMNLKPKERAMYDRNLKAKRDYENTIDYAVEVAVEKAVVKAVEKEKSEKIFMINQMFVNGLSMEMVCKITGMAAQDIEKIVQK
ncbi:Rpn family recombination-promoting nuclease/putative transposase [uncultured Cytophaga sp.]|uniref:Rpn family recombination-promoting nuclease/putative transposase n=1 Tax=uncultured Cytophaga sp. TaxID=160238 RepID=UPI00261DB556|nr:Rpn family recombination-promoting nuclease/putative transposase [uncultured Cytophaga sp.]